MGDLRVEAPLRPPQNEVPAESHGRPPGPFVPQSRPRVRPVENSVSPATPIADRLRAKMDQLRADLLADFADACGPLPVSFGAASKELPDTISAQSCGTTHPPLSSSPSRSSSPPPPRPP